MSKIILMISIICGLYTTETCAKHHNAQHHASTAPTPTMSDMYKDAHDRYGLAIEALREDGSINRKDLQNLFQGDPYLKREHAGGHAKFMHKLLSITFCVIAHGSEDSSGKTEREGFQKNLQVYLNSLAHFSIKGFTPSPTDWAEIWGKNAEAFDNYKNSPQKNK